MPMEKLPDDIEKAAAIETLPSKQESQKIESVPNVSQFAEEKISDLDAEQNEIQNSGNGEAKRIQEQYEPTPEIYTRYKTLFDGFAARSREIIGKAKIGIKEAAKGVVIGGMLAATAGIAEGNVLEKPSGKKQEGVKIELKTEKPGNEQEKMYNDGIKKIRDAAIESKVENSYYIVKKGNEYIFSDGEGGSKSSTRGYLVKEIKNYLKDDEVSSVELAHTHIAELGYSEEDISKIKNGKVEHNPMPPSITDISTIIDKKNIFKDHFDKIKLEVVEPFGAWEYSLNYENSKFDEIINEFDDEFTTEKVINESGLTKEENDALNDIFEKINFESMSSSVRFFSLIDVLKKFGSEKSNIIADKLEKTVFKKEEIIRKKYPKAYADFRKIIEIEIEMSDFKTDRAKKSVKEIIDLYRTNGITLKFKPIKN